MTSRRGKTSQIYRILAQNDNLITNFKKHYRKVNLGSKDSVKFQIEKDTARTV
jgi:hypothetical protein